MGGAVPLGYDAVNRKLRINTEEAKTVRLLFELYLKLGSVRQLQEECQRLGLRTKLRTMLDGRRSGGTAFSRGHLYLILSNPIYIGRIPHQGRSYEGEHDAIIDAETWDKVQAQLAMNAGRKRGRASSRHPSLLAGLLFTAEGVPFTPSHAVNHGRRYRYYVERSLLTNAVTNGKSAAHQLNGSGNGLTANGWRLPAHQIEQLVLRQVVAFLRDRGALLDALHFKRKSLDLVSALLARASKLATSCDTGSPASQSEIVAALVRRITLAQDRVTIEIKHEGLVERLLEKEAPSALERKHHQAITIKVPVRFRRRGVEAKLVVLDQQYPASEPDANLVKAVARAHEWFGRILRCEANGVGDIARAERLDRSYVTRSLCLAFLAPEITKAVLEGRQPTRTDSEAAHLLCTQIPSLMGRPDSIHFARTADQAAGSVMRGCPLLRGLRTRQRGDRMSQKCHNRTCPASSNSFAVKRCATSRRRASHAPLAQHPIGWRPGECDLRKWPVEIKAKNPPFNHDKRLSRDAPRKSQGISGALAGSSGAFGEGQERARKRATWWLCWQSVANCSPVV